MAIFCQEYNCLPRPGGYYDQDPADIAVLQAVAEAQEEARRRADKRARALSNHPG